MPNPICPICKKSFESKRPGKRPQVYCSLSCSAKSKPAPGFYRKGKKYGPHSKAHRKKLAIAHTGKKRPPFSKEWLDKMSVSHSGERNANWQGGITKEHYLVRMSKKMRLWRLSVLERDLFTCQNCGISGCVLEVHHLKSFAKYPELRFDINNGQTLCKKCHLKTDNYGRKSTK